MKALGDRHNGGRCVTLCQDGRVYKPRNIFWERELLSRKSRFRGIFSSCDSFELFPDLQFWPLDSDPVIGGHVERLILHIPDTSAAFRPVIFESVGRIIAFLCWMGVGDLHRDNVVFGFASKGKAVFCPLDVESVLNDFTLPSQTLLLPSPKLPHERCGLFEIFQWVCEKNDLNYVGAICKGYLEGMACFEKHGPEMERKLLKWEEILEIPVRVFPRSTREYGKIREGIKNGDCFGESKLADSERIQLRRGDIPYFFRKLGEEKILFYLEENRVESANLPTWLERQANAHIRIPQNRRFPERNLEVLKKAGVLQVAKFFLNGTKGREDYKDLSLTAGERLFLSWGDLRIQCAR